MYETYMIYNITCAWYVFYISSFIYVYRNFVFLSGGDPAVRLRTSDVKTPFLPTGTLSLPLSYFVNYVLQ